MHSQTYFFRLFFSGILLIVISTQQVFSKSLPANDSLALPSLPLWNKFQEKVNESTTTKLYQMLYISTPLIVSGLIMKSESHHFTNLRNDYTPTFRHHYDDYLQYSPAIVMLGLKTAGVKGRSSWGRMLTSDAFSVGLMALTVNMLKSSMKVKRPDGSGYNSFPSGHTATAFMTATMLHKEYGLTRSPWYSVGAYTLATATGISRQLNNRHWMSDVLTGAGIGILSAELGYYLVDLIFKDKGIVTNNLYELPYNKMYKPSFLGLYVGFNLAPTALSLTPDLRLKTTTGSCTGFEGAWFMNHYIGFGARLTISGNPITLDEQTYSLNHPDIAGKITSFETGSINTYSVTAGTYFSFPFTSRWLAGTKLLAGIHHWRNNSLFLTLGTPENPERKDLEILRIQRANNLAIGTGLSLMYVVRPGLGVRFFCDYNLSPTQKVFFTEKLLRNEYRRVMHIYTLGASVNILFLRK